MPKSNYTIALEVLAGKWGNGTERRNKITAAGYDFIAVQSIVNALVEDGYLTKSASEKEPTNPLTVDYNPENHDGIVINIIISNDVDEP